MCLVPRGGGRTGGRQQSPQVRRLRARVVLRRRVPGARLESGAQAELHEQGLNAPRAGDNAGATACSRSPRSCSASTRRPVEALPVSPGAKPPAGSARGSARASCAGAPAAAAVDAARALALSELKGASVARASQALENDAFMRLWWRSLKAHFCCV